MSRSAMPASLLVPAASLLALLDEDATARRRPLTFSCNGRGEIWRHTTNGLTPHGDRVSVRELQVLRAAASALSQLRPAGGRFEFRPETLDFVGVADDTVLLRVVVAELSA